MLNRKLIMVAIFLVSLLAVSAVSANETNGTDEVAIGEDIEIVQEDILETSHDDELSQICEVNGNSFTAIQNAIDKANIGDTINLSGNYTGTGSKIKITKPITVEGNGAVLDARNLSKVFEITATHVTLNNITFINGNDASSGAVDWWFGNYDVGHRESCGLLTNCKFFNCRAEYLGGAVYFCDNNLTMRNCYFKNNAAGDGGAVNIWGENCVIDNCTFVNNFNHERQQDDISGDAANITNCRFSFDPETTNFDMDIAQYGDNGPEEVNITIPEYDLDGSISVDGNSFSSIQKAIDFAKSGDTIKLSGKYTSSGNGRIVISKSLNIIGQDNAVLDAEGYLSILAIESDNVFLANINFINGHTEQENFYSGRNWAGAIRSEGDNVILQNCTFKDNEGFVCGGIEVSGDNCALINCNFINNKVTMDDDRNSQWKGSYTAITYDSTGTRRDYTYRFSDTAGAVRIGAKSCVLQNCTFRDNFGYYNNYDAKKAVEQSSSSGNIQFAVNAPNVTKTYGGNEKFIVTVTGNGEPVNCMEVLITIDNTDYYVMVENGQASVDLNLDVGKYDVTTKFEDIVVKSTVTVNAKSLPNSTGDEGSGSGVNGSSSGSNVNEGNSESNSTVVKNETNNEQNNTNVAEKITPKITAKDAKFKAKAKTKKYSIKLKANGKAVANAKVILKVNKKKYTATTNSKGKATFKLKLTKKGKYNAKIAYNGDNCYSKASAKAKITVKR